MVCLKAKFLIIVFCSISYTISSGLSFLEISEDDRFKYKSEIKSVRPPFGNNVLFFRRYDESSYISILSDSDNIVYFYLRDSNNDGIKSVSSWKYSSNSSAFLQFSVVSGILVCVDINSTPKKAYTFSVPNFLMTNQFEIPVGYVSFLSNYISIITPLNKIQLFDITTSKVKEFGPFITNNPSVISVDKDKIAVSNVETNKVVILDLNSGNTIKEIQATSSFSVVNLLNLDDTKFLIAYENRIEIYSKTDYSMMNKLATSCKQIGLVDESIQYNYIWLNNFSQNGYKIINTTNLSIVDENTDSPKKSFIRIGNTKLVGLSTSTNGYILYDY